MRTCVVLHVSGSGLPGTTLSLFMKLQKAPSSFPFLGTSIPSTWNTFAQDTMTVLYFILKYPLVREVLFGHPSLTL